MVNQPLNNRGDEAAHKALLRALVKEMPEVKVNVLFIDKNEDSIRQFNVNLPNVEYTNIHIARGYSRIYYWFLGHNNSKLPFMIHPTYRKVWSFYEWADVVLCAPGGICMGGFQVWLHLFFLKIAKLAKKPLAYYGRSIGPFPTETEENRRFKKLSVEMMNYFSYFSLRDKKSEKLASEMGFKYVSTVDSAFLDAPRVEIPKEISTEIGSNPYIVFVPNLLVWHFTYNQHKEEDSLKFFAKVTEEIKRAYPNHKYVMLPQLFNSPNKDYQDVLFFRKLVEYTGNKNMVVVSDKYSSDIQQTIIAGSDLVVGARYHSVVFALNNNIPCVALSYESKISGLLQTLGKEDYLCDITHVLDTEEEMDKTCERIRYILNNRPAVLKTKQDAESYASKGFDTFVKYLKEL